VSHETVRKVEKIIGSGIMTEELEERLKENVSLREQAVKTALTAEKVKTEAGRRIIFNTTQDMLGAYGLGNELRRNWEKFVKF
jgi:hypothetical protein